MDPEWRLRETVAMLALVGGFFIGANLLTGWARIGTAVVGILVLMVWIVGAMGKLGLSALR